jgi:hypothetical protein
MLSFCVVCVYFILVNTYINVAYCFPTGSVESSIPLMLADDDEDDEIYTTNIKYYSRQCMHLFSSCSMTAL